MNPLSHMERDKSLGVQSNPPPLANANHLHWLSIVACSTGLKQAVLSALQQWNKPLVCCSEFSWHRDYSEQREGEREGGMEQGEGVLVGGVARMQQLGCMQTPVPRLHGPNLGCCHVIGLAPAKL